MASEIKYIGVSLAEAIATTSSEIKNGKFQDGTTMKPEVRAGLEHFVKALEGSKATGPEHYIFTWNLHTIVKAQ